MADPLSVCLREGTKDSHRLAERTPFIRQFFSGTLSMEAYREFLVQLFHIYTALEESAMLHREHDVLGKLYFPALFRSEALRHDLDFYFGGAQWQEMPPQGATKTYVQRINALSNDWVEGLVAHHYTRYLGDLSGGQMLKRIVAKTFNSDSGNGLAFYEFPQISNHAQFKDEYRILLDSLRVDEQTARKLVHEANLAFELNCGVFDSMLR